MTFPFPISVLDLAVTVVKPGEVVLGVRPEAVKASLQLAIALELLVNAGQEARLAGLALSGETKQSHLLLASARSEVKSARPELKSEKSEVTSGWQDVKYGGQEVKSGGQEVKSRGQEVKSGWQEVKSGWQEVKSERKEVTSEWKDVKSERKDMKSGGTYTSISTWNPLYILVMVSFLGLPKLHWVHARQPEHETL